MAGLTYILDTNICIYIIKARPPSLRATFESLEPGSVGVSVVTLCELCYGVEKSTKKPMNQAALESFILALTLLPFDAAASFQFGRIRAELENRGLTIGPYDLMIAAHALSLRVTLITNDEREFRRVNGLKIENWVR